MPRSQSQRALARRAAPEEPRSPKGGRGGSGVLNAGLATLAVSVLGLGIAASALSPSSAENTTTIAQSTAVTTTVSSGVKQPSAFQRDSTTISRSNFRAALTSTAENSDELESATLTEAAEKAAAPAEVDEQAVEAREALLEKQNDAATKRAAKLETKKEAAKRAAKKKAAAAKKALGTATLPVSKYRIVARFGDVGAWARYHTGFDFSAPIGTPIHAPTAGVVEHAGSGGEAGGWAGSYVVLRHADGTQTLYAHMSSISVHVGEKVAGSDLLGHVGQTGRAFGPHLHFEVYPASATPGDVYKAVNPLPWLNKLGLKP